MTRAIALLAAVGCCAANVVAQGAQDPFELCFQHVDGTARLACFDQEMQRRHAVAAARAAGTPAVAAAPLAAAGTPGSAGGSRSSADDNVGLQGAQLERKLKQQGAQPQAVQPIVASIVRLLPRSNSEYAFELDNGQTWEQVESMSNLIIRVHDTVTIKPGLLGSFFLNTTRSQRVRVHRIS